jgi:hypothetical protein
MFKFLLGVAFGAAGYWAWQSFGRDLLGLGGEDTYNTYSSSNTSFGGSNTGYGGSMSTSTAPSSTGAGSTSESTPGSSS